MSDYQRRARRSRCVCGCEHAKHEPDEYRTHRGRCLGCYRCERYQDHRLLFAQIR